MPRPHHTPRHSTPQINAALAVGKQRSDSTTLSILDIYGFEVFENNSFEQVTTNNQRCES